MCLDDPPPPHRHQVHRRETGHAPRFLTFSCYHRPQLLGTPPLRDVFLDCLREARAGGLLRLESSSGDERSTRRPDGHPMIGAGRPFRRIAYVVMPEHAHLIVYPGHEPGHVNTDGQWERAEKVEWSRICAGTKTAVAKRIISRWKELDAPILPRPRTSDGRYRFWQRGLGFDRNVRSDGELEREIRYIHRNPVERGLVTHPTDWAWSSTRWWENRHHHRKQRADDLPCDPPLNNPQGWLHWPGFL